MKRLLSLSLLLSLFLTIQTAPAQSVTFTVQDGHEMKIDGTSNVRDWDANVNVINGELTLNEFDIANFTELTPDHFQTLTLRMPVKDIKSDSGRLTSNMQEYLKKDEHPNITFTLNSIENIEVNGSSATITANGTIGVAGVEKSTTMTVNASLNGETITFSGEQDLLMTDFGIEPPTAVFGSIRARDEIKIIYTLSFVKS